MTVSEQVAIARLTAGELHDAARRDGRGRWWAAPSPAYYALARVRDLALAAFLVVLFAPLMLLVALLIKLDSRGPVLFSQQRIGTRRLDTEGRARWELTTFRVHKFRSMTTGADPSVHEQHVKRLLDGAVGADPRRGFKLVNDARITRVGRFLRLTSLDELPQLFDVLAGHMSMVGPRPLPPYEAAHYRDSHPARFAARPGITGLWQVRGRCLIPPDEMVELDAEYVQRQSLGYDLLILLRTVPAVISRRGAG
jgi:lipopolysaccharide/colanic/teichoic acid biosynthesis glycosyltransferase